jgi:EthD domain
MSTIKMMLFVKRNPKLTHEEFREGYETRISRRAVKSFGHLWSAYRRHYAVSAQTFGSLAGLTGEQTFPYDAVTEIIFKDRAALEEMGRLSGQPESRAVINAEEEEFFDRRACWSIVAEVVEEDLAAAAKEGAA